jgi:hypothetical protein
MLLMSGKGMPIFVKAAHFLFCKRFILWLLVV